mmetsp:Transcript_41360/g.130164  ORF Transcript_41360/g.130164 Transcript_41360/m.130164 type:complete len:84 (+) Transcript_41360:434-685(+)
MKVWLVRRGMRARQEWTDMLVMMEGMDLTARLGFGVRMEDPASKGNWETSALEVHKEHLGSQACRDRLSLFILYPPLTIGYGL